MPFVKHLLPRMAVKGEGKNSCETKEKKKKNIKGGKRRGKGKLGTG